MNWFKARARELGQGTRCGGQASTNRSHQITICKQCAMTRTQHREPLLATELPSRPWEVIGADLFPLEKRQYIVTVNYYSRYLEVLTLTKTSSSAVIEALNVIFAHHEIPIVVRSDNGRFCSRQFLNRTNSPRFPQSNGATKRAVKICKEMLKEASDP